MNSVQIFERFVSPEHYIAESDKVYSLYRRHPSLHRFLALPASLILGPARLIISPIMDLVGLVALPIIGKRRNEVVDYAIATAYCFIHLVLTASFIGICIKISPIVALVLTACVVVYKILDTYNALIKDPKEYSLQLTKKLQKITTAAVLVYESGLKGL